MMKHTRPASARRSRNPVLRMVEIFCWVFGIALFGYFLQLTLGERWQAQRDLQLFMLASNAYAEAAGPRAAQFPVLAHPDQSLWSAGRRKAYLASLTVQGPAPVAVLRVPSLGIEVPVYRGTSDAVLNRGAGWIEQTARVIESGNIGIAAHRDSYFRALKNIEKDSLIELQVPGQVRRFRVASTQIVEPTDVRSLHPTDEDSLTLVTCYPFYFVGHAPQRYVVRAVASSR